MAENTYETDYTFPQIVYEMPELQRQGHQVTHMRAASNSLLITDDSANLCRLREGLIR
jgi:hypothetical protein